MGLIPDDLVELVQLREQCESLHRNYLALLARLIVAGINPRERYRMVRDDLHALHQAGLISMEMYPELNLPRPYRTPLPDCNEFTNDMVIAFRNATGSTSFK